MKQNQFEFKPFDKVLVRDSSQGQWRANIYSHLNNHGKGHVCVDGIWTYYIPYNENTAHLLGTNEPYENKLPQEKKIHVWTSGTFNEWMTEDEFKNFINTAVIHNKDITDFHVLYIQ